MNHTVKNEKQVEKTQTLVESFLTVLKRLDSKLFTINISFIAYFVGMATFENIPLEVVSLFLAFFNLVLLLLSDILLLDGLAGDYNKIIEKKPSPNNNLARDILRFTYLFSVLSTLMILLQIFVALFKS